MTAIAWNDRLRLGVPAVDADHRKLVDLLGVFLAKCAEGAPAHDLAQVLADLLEESRQHFAREEEMLDRLNFPDLAVHRAEHQVLLSQAEHFQHRLDDGLLTPELLEQTATFLQQWLLDHIQTDDRTYVPFLKRLT